MLEDKHNKVSKIDGEPNELNKILGKKTTKFISSGNTISKKNVT